MNNTLKSIQKTLLTLRPGELQTFRNHLVKLKGKNPKNTGKSANLLEILLTNKDYTDAEIAKKLGVNIDSKAFTKLYRRFREKLHESLLLGINLNRGNTYDPIAKKEIILRSKMPLVDIFASRGIPDEAYGILKDIVKAAREYELYDILASAYLTKYKLDLRYFSNSVASQTEQEYIDAEKQRKLMADADIMFYKAGFKNLKKANKELHNLEIVESISTLEKNPLLLTNGQALYYYLNLKLQLASNLEKFEDMLKFSEELIKVINSRPSLQRRIRYANAYSYSMIAAIKSLQFDKAVQFINLSRRFVPKSGVNYLTLAEHEFFNYFYNHKLNNALNTVDNMLAATAENKLTFYYNKFEYLKACCLFKLKKYGDASQIMNQIKELDNDKQGWNIGIRLFNIMSRLEKQRYDAADSQIENLRKYFENTMKHKALRKRDITILRILLKLEHHSYDFNLVYKKYAKLFDLLKVDHPDYKWLMMSHELIRFDEWFESFLTPAKAKPETRPVALIS